ALGEPAAYRRACEELLARVGPADSPKTFLTAARACVAGPDALGDFAALEGLAREHLRRAEAATALYDKVLQVGMQVPAGALAKAPPTHRRVPRRLGGVPY